MNRSNCLTKANYNKTNMIDDKEDECVSSYADYIASVCHQSCGQVTRSSQAGRDRALGDGMEPVLRLAATEVTYQDQHWQEATA